MKLPVFTILELQTLFSKIKQTVIYGFCLKYPNNNKTNGQNTTYFQYFANLTKTPGLFEDNIAMPVQSENLE